MMRTMAKAVARNDGKHNDDSKSSGESNGESESNDDSKSDDNDKKNSKDKKESDGNDDANISNNGNDRKPIWWWTKNYSSTLEFVERNSVLMRTTTNCTMSI